jgi:hypothetical protein
LAGKARHPEMLGPLLRAEERAIVQRMSDENTEVKSFFTRYERSYISFLERMLAFRLSSRSITKT